MLGADSPRTGGTKNQKATIKMLPGHVARVRVRCGKPNCRCAHGARHVAHYHVWRSDGVRFRRYVRRSEVETTRAACAAHRELQTELRIGRGQYRMILALAREVLGG
jgi:hypothetical protein